METIVTRFVLKRFVTYMKGTVWTASREKRVVNNRLYRGVQFTAFDVGFIWLVYSTIWTQSHEDTMSSIYSSCASG